MYLIQIAKRVGHKYEFSCVAGYDGIRTTDTKQLLTHIRPVREKEWGCG